MKRGHEFVVVNCDQEGKLYSRIDATDMTILSYQSPKSEAEMTKWVSKAAQAGHRAPTRESVAAPATIGRRAGTRTCAP